MKYLINHGINFKNSFMEKIILKFFFLPVFAEENLPNPLGENVTIITIIARVIKFVLGIVGVLALIMIIYGGILWMTSGGNVEQVKKGKNTLVWAILGLAIVFFAYSIVTFVIKKFVGGE